MEEKSAAGPDPGLRLHASYLFIYLFLQLFIYSPHSHTSSHRPTRFGFHCMLGFRQRKFTTQSYKSSAEGPPGFTSGTKLVIYMSLFGSSDSYVIQHKVLKIQRKEKKSWIRFMFMQIELTTSECVRGFRGGRVRVQVGFIQVLRFHPADMWTACVTQRLWCIPIQGQNPDHHAP